MNKVDFIEVQFIERPEPPERPSRIRAFRNIQKAEEVKKIERPKAEYSNRRLYDY